MNARGATVETYAQAEALRVLVRTACDRCHLMEAASETDRFAQGRPHECPANRSDDAERERAPHRRI